MVENSSRTAFLITFFSYNFFIFCFTAQLKNDNIYQHNTFNREAGGRAAPAPSLSEVVLMSTYEELQLIVSVAVLSGAILNYTHKK